MWGRRVPPNPRVRREGRERNRLRQQLRVAAGAAFAIEKRHAQIALAKIVLPIVERGGKHDAVRGAKGGSDTSHDRRAGEKAGKEQRPL